MEGLRRCGLLLVGVGVGSVLGVGGRVVVGGVGWVVRVVVGGVLIGVGLAVVRRVLLVIWGIVRGIIGALLPLLDLLLFLGASERVDIMRVCSLSIALGLI